MKNIFSLNKVFLFLFVCVGLVIAQEGVSKKISITIDDLPLSTNINYSISNYREIFLAGLHQLKKEKVPVTGFVNESFLYSNGREEKRRTSLLSDWINAGFELGNHTFSHADANKLPPQKFIEDIKKGELICSSLLQAKEKKIKYFRYPYLRTGITLSDKKTIEDFLSSSGYVIAPATISYNGEMTYAEAYRRYLKSKDTLQTKKAAADYIEKLSERITQGEKQSVNLFKREISQILVLHITELNSYNWKNIFDMIRSKGYKIVSLDEAMKDEVYQIKDTYIDHGGMDWLSRWAKAKGVSNSLFGGKQPVPSDWILNISDVKPGDY